jgi:hypothetical protein
MILSILVTAVVVTLFGHPSVRNTARLIGYAFTGVGLVVLTSMAYSLSKTSNLADFRLYQREDLAMVHFTLEAGLYGAFTAVFAFGAALVLTARPSPLLATDTQAADYDEPAAIELEVSVYPTSPKASPGAGHELYMRP